MLGTIGFLACATTGRQPNARVIWAMGSNLGLLASASAVDKLLLVTPTLPAMSTAARNTKSPADSFGRAFFVDDRDPAQSA